MIYLFYFQTDTTGWIAYDYISCLVIAYISCLVIASIRLT
jgi:hypothetical protein